MTPAIDAAAGICKAPVSQGAPRLMSTEPKGPSGGFVDCWDIMETMQNISHICLGFSYLALLCLHGNRLIGCDHGDMYMYNLSCGNVYLFCA